MDKWGLAAEMKVCSFLLFFSHLTSVAAPIVERVLLLPVKTNNTFVLAVQCHNLIYQGYIQHHFFTS